MHRFASGSCSVTSVAPSGRAGIDPASQLLAAVCKLMQLLTDDRIAHRQSADTKPRREFPDLLGFLHLTVREEISAGRATCSRISSSSAHRRAGTLITN